MIESQFYQPEIQNDQYQFHRQKRDEDSIIDASYIQVCYDQKKHTIIPLQNVNYHLKILQGVQIIELQQIYSTEKYDYPLELEYIFSINENAAATKMRVELGEKIIYGIIKEKEEAKEQYYKGIRKGKTMVYSEEDEKFPQIKRVIIGQLAPQKQLKINFQYIQPLDVFLNKFWKVDIYPIIDKNYFYLNENNQIRNNKIINYLNSKFKLTEFKFSYKQDIQITLDIGSDITFWKSPTHSLHSLNEKVNEVKNNGSNKILILKLDNIPENQNPEKQFTLLFSSDDINLPRAILTHTNIDALQVQKYCATLTLIPKFNQISLDDAYTQYLDSISLPHNQVLNRGNYLFFIDRSGSMNESRIKKAKESLILFLKSLPQDSYFNIVSFGSKYTSIWNESKQYNQDNLDEAISYIENMNADMGGTEIYTSLKQMVYNSRYGTCNQTVLNVFLLTDGEDTAEPIIQLVQNNNRAETRIYTLGIGQGCNQYLMKRMAEVGNGKCHFVSDTEDINAKIIDLLEDSLTPYLKDFKLETNAIKIYSIIPNPEQIVSLKKNQELTIQILFSSQQDQENIQFNINCFDSQDQKPINYSVNLNLNQSQNNEYFHKLAAHKFITFYENALKYGQQQVNFIQLNKQHLDVMDIVNLSTENQILSNKTAFVCEICELEDQFKYKVRSKVIIELPQKLSSYSHEERSIKSCSPANFVQHQEQAQMPICFSRQSAMPNIFPSNQAMPLLAPSFQENLSKKQCQLSEQKKKDVENDKLSFQLLIQFAQADGSFKISNVIQLKINFNNLNKEQGLKEEVWNTLLILLYLEKHCSEDKKSWQLVFSKGIVFLLKNGINYMEKKIEYENLLV